MWSCEHCKHRALTGFSYSCGRTIEMRLLWTWDGETPRPETPPSWCPLRPKWRSVENDPPEEEFTDVWVAWTGGDLPRVAFVVIEDVSPVFVINDIVRPDYWMLLSDWPMPAPPEEDTP